MQEQIIHLNSAEDTRKLGAAIASCVESSIIIALSGQLGAGKTTFTQGLAEELGIEESVSSPTFLMLNEYHSGQLPLYHFDLYRLQEDLDKNSVAVAALVAELDEIMSQKNPVVVVIEWVDLYEEICGNFPSLFINMRYLPESEGREAILSANDPSAKALLRCCMSLVQADP